MRIIGVGDNTVDKYKHLKRMFPGGNAVNVAVFARRHGHEASYLGWLGNDIYGQLLLDALKEEDVDTSRCRVLDGSNAHCEVDLVEGERTWTYATPGARQFLSLTEDDLAYVREHDLTHSSIFSYVERDLLRLSDASPTLSYDFSNKWTREYLAATLPSVDIAILSYPDHNRDDAEALMRWVLGLETRLVLVTQGHQGATAFDGRSFYRQEIVETAVVDTLGAGDSFAARFLVDHLSGRSIPEAMTKAAESAAQTCGYYGAFGHGIPYS
jgi:fructoselysine 6-kinase